jgi:ribosome-binding factor A
MPPPTRQQRLASLLHREIASAVRALDDPRIGMVTITRVEVTGDLQLVTAFWTAMGGARERKLAEHALASARGFIRTSYAPTVRTRLVPDLVFSYDDREQKREAMNEIISRARRTDADHGERPEPPAPDPTDPVIDPPEPADP